MALAHMRATDLVACTLYTLMMSTYTASLVSVCWLCVPAGGGGQLQV